MPDVLKHCSTVPNLKMIYPKATFLKGKANNISRNLCSPRVKIAPFQKKSPENLFNLLNHS